MKYKFDLINPYSPRSKCGAEALIGAGLGLGSSIFNGISTSSTNASNRKWTSVENEKNRQFNSRESQKQRDWAHDEWLSQFNKQSQEWYNQQATLQEQQWQNFLRQADYNSPRNQVSRMADAGFNPSAAFSQGSSGLVSAATGNIANVPSPSVPTGGTVSGNAASASPVSPLNAPAPQVDLGSLGSFLANAGKAYNENKKLRPEIDSMLANIQNVIADTANKELLNIAQTMENDILEQTKNAKVQKSWQDLKLAFVETNLKMAQGELVQAQTLHEYVNKYLDECKANLTVEQYMQACIYTANMQKILDSEINLNNQKASESGANALVSKYNAGIVLNVLNNWDTTYKNDQAMKRLEFEKLKAEMPAMLEKLLWDNKISSAQYYEALKRINKLDVETLNEILKGGSAAEDLTSKNSPINKLLNYSGLGAITGIFSGLVK